MSPALVDLGGEWDLESDDLRLKARVPGDVHLDLLRAGRIPDPMVGDNVLKCRPWERRQWRYAKEFATPPGSIKQFRRAELVFEGLDTHARIRLNDRAVGETRNAFRPHGFDVTGDLTAHNRLEVDLDDGLALADTFDVDRYITRPEERESLRRLVLRKPQFVFGWDWAPRLISCGIWRPVRLNLYQNLALRSVWIKGRQQDRLQLSLTVENFTPERIEARVVVRIDGREQNITLHVAPGCKQYDCQIELPYVKLWQPWTAGEPFCYTLTVQLWHQGCLEAERNEIFGLRTIEVIQQKDAEDGTSFTFAVNGVKVFARGGNWVPADLIFCRADEGRYRQLLDLAREQRCNMLRVWGGGIYEDPVFYRMCSQKGILVWQDFMFACGFYPDDDDAFVAEVKQEAAWAVTELRNYPCLALWCGNNENNTAFWNLHHKEPERFPRFYGESLYATHLPAIVAELHPAGFYWPSSDYSPSGDDPKSMQEGDHHSWSVYGIDLDKYYARDHRFFYLFHKTRFSSEFGQVAFSLEESIRKFSAGAPLELESGLLALHANTQGTPRQILEVLRLKFGERIDGLPAAEILRLSQFYQAYILGFTMRYYQSRKYLTAGALYWMFNDNWPTSTSWVSVDYYGARTPLFWSIRRAFAELVLFIKPLFMHDQGGYEVHLINNTSVARHVKVAVGLIDSVTGSRLDHEEITASIAPDTARCLRSKPLPADAVERGNLFIYAHPLDGADVVEDVCPVSLNFRNVSLREAPIAWTFSNGHLSCRSDGLHWAVGVVGKDVGDNYFPLLPGRETVIRAQSVERLFSLNALLACEPSLLTPPCAPRLRTVPYRAASGFGHPDALTTRTRVTRLV